MNLKCMRVLFLVAFVAGGFVRTVHAQAPFCQVQWGVVNGERRVAGEVDVECPPSLHSATWGNWGVSSNVGNVINGNQFQGFRPVRPCWNCATQYQWNSCTRDHLRPDCYYYNDGASGCYEQSSYLGNNLHGAGYDRIPVSCPADLDYDGVPDIGGCRDVTEYSILGNYMSLYELDTWDTDDLVTTLYFPGDCCTAVFTCDVFGCTANAASPWTSPDFSTYAETGVSAQIALVVTTLTFADFGRVCGNF